MAFISLCEQVRLTFIDIIREVSRTARMCHILFPSTLVSLQSRLYYSHNEKWTVTATQQLPPIQALRVTFNINDRLKPIQILHTITARPMRPISALCRMEMASKNE